MIPIFKGHEFGWSLLTRLTKAPLCVTIAPTRELARQIFNDFELLGAASQLVVKCFYGGATLAG